MVLLQKMHEQTRGKRWKSVEDFFLLPLRKKGNLILFEYYYNFQTNNIVMMANYKFETKMDKAILNAE